MSSTISTPNPLQKGEFGNIINVNGIEISWDMQEGLCNFRGIPVALMWVDSTLAGLMAGVASMVGAERFNLALQAEGRKSVDSDWLLISSYPDFKEGFAQLNLNAKVAGWGNWQLINYDPDKQECRFRAFNNWEGGYQKALGVCWGSGMLAGKFAGICSKLFNKNCWAVQTMFVAKGDPYDEFIVTPSERNLENEIDNLLHSDQATRADMAVALKKLEDIQKTLLESEQRYEQLVRTIPVGVYTWYFHTDGSMGFKYVSPKFCEILEMEADALINDYRLAFDSVHPDDYESLMRCNDQSRIFMAPFRWEGRFSVRGEIRWINISSDPIPQPDGSSFWSGVVKDITEKKQAEDELRVAATTFETQEAIMITDVEANIIRVNQAFEQTTGYSAKEVIGKNPRLLSSGRHDTLFFRQMWHDLLTIGSWSGEIWDKHKDGHIYPKYATITAVKDSNSKTTHYVSVFVDISARKQAEAEIHNLAFYDPLTGLSNRRLMIERLGIALSASSRSQQYGALLFLDLDKFKTLNDTLGHAFGDLLLIEVANRLRSCMRDVDTIARLGGDEFLLLIEDLGVDGADASQNVAQIAEKVRSVVASQYQLKDHTYHSSPSIGICLFCGNAVLAEELVKRADIAMYQAKDCGRNKIRFYDPELQKAIETRAAMEADLRKDIAGDRLKLYYQVQVDQNLLPIGAEALLRWSHPQRGMIPPSEFIPLAEESSLILEIGQWVLDRACRQLATWSRNPLTCHFTLAVNISAHQFMQPDFVEHVNASIERHRVDPSRLKLELTESVALDNLELVIEKMRALKQRLGTTLSLDDFGTGYSSLSCLKRLPLDQVKIDQSFVRGIRLDRNEAIMVKTIIDLARNFSLQVIAEGVETDEQLALLRQYGCEAYQGYLFGKPLPIDQFEASLTEPRFKPNSAR
ncbi:EAL domain-containing protein [Methylomicrobium sp. RS1]|jgi:diguanylate cyclase (GGDEF)-like protein/PAS domain S-box-containing protein|uniref:EAL domain-containing protein n=1 Tax=Candidatus Methylomicrobium oryzae TaxID=2802053 RepID=UPI0019206AA7|nr:EAL domain-containing protein [Methylomicrobium sp. RS1]MBL1264234.1 EAL domain-containing protein [Methylomicrobium sp. RS1]